MFSGDTAYFPPLAAFAKGADILVHEVMYGPALEDLVRRNPNAATLMAHLKASHTLTDDVGRIATEAGVKTLVLSHLVPADAAGMTGRPGPTRCARPSRARSWSPTTSWKSRCERRGARPAPPSMRR